MIITGVRRRVIRRVLRIAPSTYHHHQAVNRDSSRASLRAQCDTELSPKIKARCTVVRLMKKMGLQGVTRGKGKKTIYRDPAQPCPEDKVNRDFKAPAPNVFWVADFTYVRTAVGFVYVAFIIDVLARCIMGWQVSSSPNSKLVLDALEQAICQRAPSEADKLSHHRDRGVQYPSIKYSERLEEAKIGTSVGGVGDSCDNALAETINGLYKAEVIEHEGPWRGKKDVDLATLGWVHWYNGKRLFGLLGYISRPQPQKGTYRTQNSRLKSPLSDKLQRLRLTRSGSVPSGRLPEIRPCQSNVGG